MQHTDQTDFEKWLRGRLQSRREPDVSSEFLAAQRRNIYRRLDEQHRNWIPRRWPLSIAMLVLMFAGGLTLRHRDKITPAISDEQLFADLTAMEQSNEPKAIQPMHGLFQE